MATVFLTYKLKPGIAPEQYESWIREVDYPALRGLKRVSSLVTRRTTHRLFDEGAPSADYVEVLEIPDLDGFLAEDLPGEVMQKIMGEFSGFVENTEFMVAEEV